MEFHKKDLIPGIKILSGAGSVIGFLEFLRSQKAKSNVQGVKTFKRWT